MVRAADGQDFEVVVFLDHNGAVCRDEAGGVIKAPAAPHVAVEDEALFIAVLTSYV